MITSASLNDILFLGKYEYTFELGPHEVKFNLCTVGQEQDSINSAHAGETNQKAALMAASLISVKGYKFSDGDDSFLEKYRFLRALKRPVFDHLWDNYNAALTLQFKAFNEFIEKDREEVKKS